ncbi:transglutaminase-like domain-containing protein [Sphingomonas glacialis]|uniref:Transglutaminase family protein n=1 Tax=Sphingomonas glacialis TaxID=658225 RepID=A0A502FYL8_9SPHN|nr:transglutaminase family protein [Sphingomonas glacialis]TPG54737.1 transglutaminase family protein [Sphingomonas glacialis]
MRLGIDVTLDYTIDGAADVLLLVEAAKGSDQRLELQDLRVYSNDPIRAVPGEDGIGQRCWARGDGPFRAEYRAIVEIVRSPVDLATLGDTPIRLMPPETIPYLLPSRYCESDRLEGFVQQKFADLTAGPLAVALTDWVSDHLTYACGTSTGTTTAMMTFAERRGVCRDYAHLLVALARAGGIPARCVSAYAPGVDPPDFHAVAELWIGGGWHLIDATRMASCADLVRVAVGRDATDIAFMTVFGSATLNWQNVAVTKLP